MEARYILSLCDAVSPEESLQELLSFTEDSQAEPFDKKCLSENCILFLKLNISRNQLAILQFLHIVKDKNVDNREVTEQINKIILNEVQNILDAVLECAINNKKHNTGHLLSILPHVAITADNEDIRCNVFPKLHVLFLAGYQKEIFLSLLSRQGDTLTRLFTDFKMKQHNIENFLDLDPNKMIDLCFAFEKHWLLEIISNTERLLRENEGSQMHSTPFLNKVWQLVVINVINKCSENMDSSDLGVLENLLSILEYQHCEQNLILYINEIYRQLHLYRFCMNHGRRKVLFGWRDKVQTHSALSLVSQICDMATIDRYKMKQTLTLNNDLLNKLGNQRPTKDNVQWDLMTYNAFCILISVIDVILLNVDHDNNRDIASKIDEIKIMLSQLYPLSYRIEILQNIFSCLFLRYEHFSREDNVTNKYIASHSDSSYFIDKNMLSQEFTDSTGFLCNAPLAHELLSVIKHTLSDIEKSVGESKKSNVFLEKMVKKMVKTLSNAEYRWQLVTSLNISTPPKLTSMSYLYNVTELSSDDEQNDSQPKVKRKLKSRKVRSKSVNEQYLKNKSHLKQEENKKKKSNEPDFISLMLASPNTLLALCLESGEFSKAHRIVEVYDLVDTEGSVEVSYTERFLATAAQIRNNCVSNDKDETGGIDQIEKLTGISVISATVVSVVESFLSTTRAPYNYQITELARTYPQLQLYDHRNSPLISITDLLLSTGLNRNITYGILNVLEKKYHDLNVSIDVDSKTFNLLIFIKNIIKIFYDIYQSCDSPLNKSGICDVLRTDKASLRHKEYAVQKEFLNEISRFYTELTQNDYSSANNDYKKNYEFLVNVLPFSGKDVFNIYNSETNEKFVETSYLKMFYNYLKSINKLLHFNKAPPENDADILNVQVHEIVGDLILKQNIPVESVELLCKNQGINLIHKIVLNCCPSIQMRNCVSKADMESFGVELLDLVSHTHPVQTDEDSSYKNLDISTVFSKPNKPVISYILLHNWVIANLVKKIHSDLSEYIFQQSMDTRTLLLDLYLQLPKFEILKAMFHDNIPLTALQTQFDLKLVINYLRSFLQRGKLHKCLEVIEALPEHQLVSCPFIKDLKDQILLKLSVQDDNENNWKYFLYISNRKLQLENLFNNLINWPSAGAVAILEYVLQNPDFELGDLAEECKDWLTSIPVYNKISHFIPENTWATIHFTSNEDPESVLQVLMDAQQFGLCLSWANIHNVSTNMKNLIIQNHLKQILESSSDLSKEEFSSLIETLPTQQTVSLCENMLLTIRNLSVVHIILHFLLSHSCDAKQYENIKVGTDLMSEMDVPERAYFWEIINKPLLIIEQYLMNAKLDKLEKLLSKIKPSLKTDSLGDNLFYNISQINLLVISVNAVDALLRYYAAKALDLKSTNRISQAFKPEEMFHQSIDSINVVGDTGAFVMPIEVPNREQWVPDNFTDKCMSCKTTIFSVLIRRHHCRRCGRLVCYSCSRNKLQITGLYDDIKVRVCIDCHNQTMNKSENRYAKSNTQPGSSSGYSDHMSMEWCLTADPKHNSQLRREFIYEFSPNVTLCLSIMKMHTINYDYPRFLLDRSDELSSAASNDGGSASARELLKMRRALLLWCTVLYSRPMFSAETNSQQHTLTETALAHTQRQMAVTDALTLLFKQGCYHVIQKQNLIDNHCIRGLLETEKWEVTLEISTKFGMSRYGVLAAWGKACLKAGCFQQARQKFALCFKTPMSNAPSQVFEQETTESKEPPSNKTILRLKKMEHSASSSHVELSRVRNNPSLLAEIISLLENISYPLNQQIVKTADTLKSSFEKFTFGKKNKKVVTPEPALNVMHALASVSKIKAGDLSDFTTTHQYITKPKTTGLLKKQQTTTEKCTLKRKMESFFYKECIYYLTTYGMHGAIIEFYFKYGSTQEALQYCLDNNVDKEVFTDNIFMSCLKTNKINNLLQAMSEIDSTWNIWTDYILHVCRVLERTGNLSALHSIQSGVGDHVRAAMTCAALYTQPTKAPHAATLMERAHHLAEAKGHLQHVPRKLNKDSLNKESTWKTLHLKLDGPALDTHINTICRQLEVAKFLYTCEIDNRLSEEMVEMIMLPIGEESLSSSNCFLPTLFDSHTHKTKLAVLLIACAPTIDEGFGIASRTVEEHFLEPLKVYQQAARYLVNVERYEDVVHMCDCIKKWTITNADSLTEGVVELSVGAIVRKCDSKGILFDELAELLIQKVDNVAVKISCYIECRLLKTAYALALKNNRMGDLKKVMREAERLGQTQVKNACMKRLKVSQ